MLVFSSAEITKSVAPNGAPSHVLVEIKDGTGVGRKVRITREDPTSMLPGAESVGAPMPQGGAADFRDEALRNHVLPDLLDGEA
jgi:hypothetical protein